MKIFGIPVNVDRSFLFICALLAFGRIHEPVSLIEWLIVIFLSLLVHELGHALMVRAYGMSPQILLYSMGGLTSWNDEKGISHAKRISISLAGPFAGFIFGGLVFLSRIVYPDLFSGALGEQTYEDLVNVNFLWGFFNLLPILPLDGGQVAHSIEQSVKKKPDGTITHILSLVVAGAVGLWALSIGWIWVVFLMALFAMSNGGALFKMIQSNRDRPLSPALAEAREAISNDDGATAVHLAKKILSSAKSLEVKEEAQRIITQGLILENDIEHASKEADRLQAVYGHEELLRALTGFKREQLSRAIPLIEYSYASAPSPDLNFVYANALIFTGRLQDAASLIAGQQLPEYALASYKTLQSAAFQSGAYEISSAAGRQAFERAKDPDIAYNVACAEARAGRADEALAWIERAVGAGFKDAGALASDLDFEFLRSRPEFGSICGRLGEA